MADQTMDEDSQSAAPADESASKVEGSEKDSTQVFVIIVLRVCVIVPNFTYIIS